MNLFKHLRQQPFLFAVSVAAITHSTWSFAVMFTGLEPHPQLTISWFLWVLPGALLSFSIDIGLLSLAYQIRSGQRNLPKLAAFGILSLAMCYAQFVYISSHMPAFPLASGVRAEWSEAAQLIRDCAIWVFPALLPVALVLYAFSDTEQAISVDARTPQTAVKITDVDDRDLNTLASGEKSNLAIPESVNSANGEMNVDQISVEQEQSATNSALIVSKREYAIRTTEHHCGYCGVAFVPKSANQIYHSASCRTLAYEQRKATKTTESLNQ